MLESGVINLLRKSVVPEARRSGGTFLVEYGRPLKAVALVAWILALAMTALCIDPAIKIEPQVVPIIVGGFFFLALFLHSEFFLVRITYNDACLYVHTRWGGQRRVAWQDIDSVHFSKLSQCFVVEQEGGRRFTFNYFMSGYQSLLAEIQERHS
jgi:hypothetical protein